MKVPNLSLEFLPVTWDELHRRSLELAHKVLESGYFPDVIIAILRGGYVIARIIADVIDVDELGVVEVKFYKGIGETAERPVITQPLVTDVRGKNVLIVDDVVDSFGRVGCRSRFISIVKDILIAIGRRVDIDPSDYCVYIDPHSRMAFVFYAKLVER